MSGRAELESSLLLLQPEVNRAAKRINKNVSCFFMIAMKRKGYQILISDYVVNGDIYSSKCFTTAFIISCQTVSPVEAASMM